jgi:hypothetical protein
MPVHVWTVPPVGLYHHFQQSWAVRLAEGLNDGVLPEGFFALVDQRAIGLIPDVLALGKRPLPRQSGTPGGVAVSISPPKARFISQQTDREVYASRANRVAVRNAFGELVAIIELVSPGNKDSKNAMKAFIEKTTDFLSNGVNLLVIDLFPPTPRDPEGIQKVIWDEIREEPFQLPPDKRLTIGAYSATMPKTAYIEAFAPGDTLPGMPLFLDPGIYVPSPLEETYMQTWQKCPIEMKEVVEGRAASGE